MTWIGWQRLSRRGCRWEPVVTAGSYDAAWQALLSRKRCAGAWELIVMEQGRKP